MQVKNTTKTPIKFVVRENLGEMVDKLNADEEVIGKKPAKPKLKTIIIGQGCTVEIEDKDWHQIWDAKGQAANGIDEYKEEHIKLQGTDKDKPLTVTRKEATSYRTIFTTRNLVKKGALEIIKKAAPKESQEEMLAVCRKALGLDDWKPADKEALLEMYAKVG